MTDIAQIYNLQKLDINWAKMRRRLLQIQKLLGESDEVVTARQKVATTETELQQWQAQQRDNELESQSLAARMAETEAKLMSGEITNPKELESLQASLEALRRQRTTADDTSVEAMLKSEELTARLQEVKSSLQVVAETWQSGQTELMKEGQMLKQQYLVLQEKRKLLASQADAAMLEHYEQLRKRKAGIAVAVLNDDSCGACHMQVPRGVISSVSSADSNLTMCPSCGRILFSG